MAVVVRRSLAVLDPRSDLHVPGENRIICIFSPRSLILIIQYYHSQEKSTIVPLTLEKFKAKRSFIS